MENYIEITNDSWDYYFMRIARDVGMNSKCLSKHIGSVLVKDKHIIATGYNGPPSGIPPCFVRLDDGTYTDDNSFVSEVCPRTRMGFGSGKGLEHCPAVHSEVNTIIQAAKFGTSTLNATLYCDCGIPCHNCAKEIINAGIIRVVCSENSKYAGSLSSIDSEWLFSKAGIILNLLPMR